MAFYPMSDFLLRRGRFHRSLATPASAFLSTGVTSRPTDGSQRHALDIQSRVDIAVVPGSAAGARPCPNGQRHGIAETTPAARAAALMLNVVILYIPCFTL